ncbi:tetraacyldisaccharide 4'-kinase [Pusillimonas sp. NJUB218]|uniref:tetraacyldisaccharide 4'-kinase n=1 Tax=Pusillimonas sp. NJUB218 TaxID=2023230 RepID=UPI001F16A09E|nr:tetraacyldisaccharide 4'-kinase [Pusillimonas sp. NJUB218]
MSFRQRLVERVHDIWQTPGLISTLLLPLSWLVWLFVTLKRRRWQKQPPARPTHLPVIVVGNLVVGGTGKTPVVIALVKGLQALGLRPGVISRGYGAQSAGAEARTGVAPLDPAQFGDEPSLIASATGAPVAVHPKRALAQHALHSQWPEVNIVISDDGLQHLALARDIEVVVQDARGLGNGRLLPAGPLREPRSRLNTVDLIITNATAADTREAVTNPHRHKPLPGMPSHVPQLRMQLQPVSCTHLQTGEVIPWARWRQQFASARIGAVAAIGQPERFFGMLRRLGVTLDTTLALPDHDTYKNPPFDKLDTKLILVTDKDAVKCLPTTDARLWSVQVSPRFSDDQWVEHLYRQLQSRSPT